MRQLNENHIFIILSVIVVIILGYLISSTYDSVTTKGEYCKQQNGVFFSTRDGNICIRKDAIISTELDKR